MKKNPILIICAFSLLLTFSCSDNSDEEDDSSISIVDVTGKALLAPVFGETDSAAKTAAVGANDFAFRLSALLANNHRGNNFVFSPFSVWMPLAALVNATVPQYKDDLLTALGAAGITQDDMNRAASRMLYDLTDVRNEGREEHYNPLKIVNAIFVDNNKTLRRDFAQTFMDYYRGSSIHVDFSTREAAHAVNRWASRNTNGLITDLIQEFDPETIVAIANAIYFSDRWAWEFSRRETQEDVFHAPTGDTTAWYMRRQGSDQSYYEDDKVQAMPLGFKNSGGMYIILPKAGSAEDLLTSMTNDYFLEIRQNMQLARGTLLLPRFSITNDIVGLKEALTLLGVPLFEGFLLTGLVEEDPVLLTDAIQRAVIEVDERGTTAAAVTIISGNGSDGGSPPNIPFEMICNKPFVFILCDYTYDGGSQVLFTGMVNKP